MEVTDRFHLVPYRQIVEYYPSLQEKVYKKLIDLSPKQFIFELEQTGKYGKFNRHNPDTKTYGIVSEIMMELLDDRRLILTSDDIWICYNRMSFLLFAFEAVKQGLWTEHFVDSVMVYRTVNHIPLDRKPKKTKIVIHDKKKFYKATVR